MSSLEISPKKRPYKAEAALGCSPNAYWTIEPTDSFSNMEILSPDQRGHL
jgi:hypothetical protein